MARRGRYSRAVAGAAAVALAAAFVTAPLSADFAQDAWRHSRAIELPSALGPDGLVEALLDEHVFENAQPGLQDIRVVEADSGQEVGYKLVVEQGIHRRNTVSLTVRDLGRVPGQHTRFTVDVGQAGALHNELEIQTPTRNFQRDVKVEASRDLDNWAVLTESNKIYDFTVAERAFSARDARLRYPASSARYLRVTVADGPEPPLEISGALAFNNQEIAPREKNVPLTILARETDAAARSNSIVMEVAATGHPTGRIAFLSPQLNFDRPVSLAGSDDLRRWEPLVSLDRLYSYDTSRFSGEKLYVVYGESTFRYYRLTIFNEDNEPVPIVGATAYGIVRKVIFQADPAKTYNLYYGNREARSPSYDFERIFPALVTEEMPAASLGPAAPNARYVGPTPVPPPREVPLPFTEKNDWLLPLAVAVGGLVVGLFLANLLRQIKKVLPPPPQEGA